MRRVWEVGRTHRRDRNRDREAWEGAKALWVAAAVRSSADS